MFHIVPFLSHFHFSFSASKNSPYMLDNMEFVVQNDLLYLIYYFVDITVISYLNVPKVLCNA